MGSSSAAGTKIHIGTTATDPLTDTYIEIGSLASLGEFGISFAEVTFDDLGQGETFTFKGARKDGTLAIGLGKDATDAGQKALDAALLAKDNYNFKIVYNDAAPPITAPVTISVASPGVVTWTGHGLAVNTAIKFATSGTLPTGLVAGTTYYIKTVLDQDTFTVAATVGGTAIVTTGSAGTGHSATTIPAPSTDYGKARVMSKTTNVGSLTTVLTAAVNLAIKTGSLSSIARLPAPPAD